MKKVSIVVGTRPNLVKLSPFANVLKKAGSVDFQIIDTGQHYDYEMDEQFVEELGIPKPIFLEIGSGLQGEQTGNALMKIEKELLKFKPGIVVVIGDTNSTLAGALAAAKLNIPVAHIEAGLRSFDRKMPEEINRVVVDHISEILFAPTENSVKNLKDEGISKERVVFTQDITVDACLGNYERAKKSPVLKELGITGEFVLVTLHRPSNVDDKKTVSAILGGLMKVARWKNVVFSIHPRTLKRLQEFEILEKYDKTIKFIKPQGYFDFLKLLGSAACVVTDSGGVQKEALILKTPCVTVRDTTEWPETLSLGGNVLVESVGIVNEVSKRSSAEFRKFMQGLKNPYGDGKAAERMVSALLNFRR